MIEYRSITITKRIKIPIYRLLFLGVLTGAPTSGYATHEATVEPDLSISIPVLTVGSDYYQATLRYEDPNWVVASASVIDSEEVISATFEGSTLTINCLVYNDVEYSLTMNLIDAETFTFALGAAGENSGCSNEAGGDKPSLEDVST